jgi:hypothetical protein
VETTNYGGFGETVKSKANRCWRKRHCSMSFALAELTRINPDFMLKQWCATTVRPVKTLSKPFDAAQNER